MKFSCVKQSDESLGHRPAHHKTWTASFTPNSTTRASMILPTTVTKSKVFHGSLKKFFKSGANNEKDKPLATSWRQDIRVNQGAVVMLRGDERGRVEFRGTIFILACCLLFGPVVVNSLCSQPDEER